MNIKCFFGFHEFKRFYPGGGEFSEQRCEVCDEIILGVSKSGLTLKTISIEDFEYIIKMYGRYHDK